MVQSYDAAGTALMAAVYLLLTLCVIFAPVRPRILQDTRATTAAAVVFLGGALERGVALDRALSTGGGSVDTRASWWTLSWQALPVCLLVYALIRGWVGARRSSASAEHRDPPPPPETAHDDDGAVRAAAPTPTSLATMSHEIRTPLNAVIGMTDLLMDTPLSGEQQEFLNTVRLSSDELLAVVDDILDTGTGTGSGSLGLTPTVFNLREEVESCLDLVAAVASAKGLDLVSYVDDSCPVSVLGDRDRIREILVNLLSNAVKFTESGEVLLTVTTTSTAAHLELTIDVTDTGIGISQDAALKLYRSFSQVEASATRDHGDTDLGLVVCQRLAQAMGGDVTVTSTVGRGSTFTVTLLLEHVDLVASVPQRSIPETPTLDGLSVLVVDDNATNLRILDLQLTSLGMSCTTALTSVVALGSVSDGVHYDVAVVDLTMPEMSGLDLAAAIRSTPAGAATPVVLLTRGSNRNPRTNDHISATLTKPVKSEALRATLVSVLSSRPRSPELSPRPSGPDHGPTAGDSDATAGVQTARSEVSLRILLVEDNLVNQKVAQLMLDKLGHSVDSVVNGREALEAIRHAPYNVVLMDVQMPEMDGLEATRRIRAELPAATQPVIIAMTANTMIEDRRACTSAGMDAYLAKPVRINDLRSMLDEVGETIRHFTPDQLQVPLERMLQPEAAAVRLGATASLPLDVFVIDRLRDRLDDPDDSAFAALVNTYILDGAVTVTELSAAVAVGDLARVRSIAHSWSSSSALLGASTLAALLTHAEQAAQESPAELGSITELIRAEHARVAASLELLSPERLSQARRQRG